MLLLTFYVVCVTRGELNRKLRLLQSDNEISGFMRNASAHVLRFLKVWYELPSDAFFLAINIIDRFLTRMKALPRHLSCIAVSSFHVACEELSSATGLPVPSRESVSLISQSKCKSGDVQRMEEIIRTKLELGMHVPDNATGDDRNNKVMGINSNPITSLTFLKLLYAGLEQLRDRHFPQLPLPALVPLINKLEVVACDTRAANCRPAELAVALLRRHLISLAKTDPAAAVAARTACLQPLMTLCKVNSDAISKIEDLISVLLYNYDNERGKTGMAVFQRQRLVWRLSNRTMRHLKIINKFKRLPKLSCIEETDRDAIEEREICSLSPINFSCDGLILNDSDGHSISTIDFDSTDDMAAECKGDDAAPTNSGEHELLDTPMESETEEVDDDNFETTQENEQDDDPLRPSVLGEEESMETSDAEIDESDGEEGSSEEQEEKMEGDCQNDTEYKSSLASKETVAHSRAAAAAAGYHSDKEESYCQVAKKMKEDRGHVQSPRMETSRAIVRDEVLRSRMRYSVRTSPPSKITLTPVLPQHSSAVKNLTPILQGNSFDYARPRLSSVLGIESVDGEVTEPQLLPFIGVDANISFVSSHKNTKRKKLRQFQLSQHRNEGSDTDLSSELTSSEEEMDSDYEKEFPPLPVPRPVLARIPSIGKNPVAIKKKKKKSDVMPYVAKNKTLPGRRIMVN
ncbi:Cyclin N-terminal [Trinorchestia longiramus]|nr:Cyclin N-terminal [Trinorchestia longiramus]